MKKRLRKKKRCGEFTEWGRQALIVRNRKAKESKGRYGKKTGKRDRLP